MHSEPLSPLQKTNGIILHFLATRSAPNLSLYHCLVRSAVTPRPARTNKRDDSTVRFTSRPSGAVTIDNATYKKNSQV